MRDTTFTRMQDATREDYAIIGRRSLEFFAGLPDRILRHLELLEGDTGGYAVTRLTHSLQTATRAERDGRDEEYVVCALLHDIGDTLASANHADLAALGALLLLFWMSLDALIRSLRRGGSLLLAGCIAGFWLLSITAALLARRAGWY